MRKIIIVFLLIISFSKAYAQKSIEDLYQAYTVIRTTNDNKLPAIELALDVLKRSSELTNTQIANLNFHVGRLYEETKQEEKASPYYEESLKLAPDYYVTHRALGNIYLKRSTALVQRMNEAGKAQQMDTYNKLFSEYKKITLMTLPHLEKAQACDPDEQGMQQIRGLYKNIKDLSAANTLDERLKKLAVTCVDLLED